MRTLRGLGCAVLLLMFAGPWRTGSASAQTPNACGCYRDDAGACRCTKKSKCGCPEECEPVGCEEKRQREAGRQADAELKRIAAREKKAGEAARALKKKGKPAKQPLDRAAEAAKREL